MHYRVKFSNLRHIQRVSVPPKHVAKTCLCWVAYQGVNLVSFATKQGSNLASNQPAGTADEHSHCFEPFPRIILIPHLIGCNTSSLRIAFLGAGEVKG